jgi:cell division protein FtsN
MSRDYKTREGAPRARRRRGGSCFFWFMTGALLGAIGVAVAWMLQGFEPAAQTPAATPPPQTQAPPPKPRFVYPDILPEMEVVVSDDELKDDRPPALPPPPPPPAPAPEEAAAAAPTPAEPQPPKAADAAPAAGGDAYLLQVGSFKARSDAERLKAKLALLGVQAQIQQVTINGKDTYHRVRTGPYQGKEAANKTRAMLERKGYETIAIKLK